METFYGRDFSPICAVISSTTDSKINTQKLSNLEFQMDKCTQAENEGVKSLHAVL